MAKRDKEIDYVWKDRKRPWFGLPLSFTRYYLTEERLITRKGFFNIEEDELELYRITDKSLYRPIKLRIFGCGTIAITAKDDDTPHKKIECIKCPREVSDLIGAFVSQQKDRFGIRGRDMVGTASDDHCDC